MSFGFWKWIATQIRDYDRASLLHYRRKLPFSMSPVVVAQPLNVGNVLQQTAFYHSPKMSDALCKVLTPDEQKILNGPMFFPYCIFKAPRRLIWEWVNYVEPRILQCMQILGCPLDFEGACEFVRNDETFTTPVDKKNTDIVYQARVGAFIGERLNTVFWQSLNINKEFKPATLLETNQRI